MEFDFSIFISLLKNFVYLLETFSDSKELVLISKDKFQINFLTAGIDFLGPKMYLQTPILLCKLHQKKSKKFKLFPKVKKGVALSPKEKTN